MAFLFFWRIAVRPAQYSPIGYSSELLVVALSNPQTWNAELVLQVPATSRGLRRLYFLGHGPGPQRRISPPLLFSPPGAVPRTYLAGAAPKSPVFVFGKSPTMAATRPSVRFNRRPGGDPQRARFKPHSSQPTGHFLAGSALLQADRHFLVSARTAPRRK